MKHYFDHSVKVPKKRKGNLLLIATVLLMLLNSYLVVKIVLGY
jgi:hypothetical protein